MFSKNSTSLPIAIALDGNWESSKVWLDRLKGRVWGFKVGSILFCERGPSLIEEILKRDLGVFLDLKFCDIPNTVEGAVSRAFSWGVQLTTVHAFGGSAMLKAAAAQQRPGQAVVAVTVLTSLDQGDLKSIGVERELGDQVNSLGQLAMSSGIKGLVCSPLEVENLRKQFPSATLVTPGVRLGEAHDQKRTASLAEAFKLGSSLPVLGRALTESKNWEQTWEELTSSLAGTSLKKLSL